MSKITLQSGFLTFLLPGFVGPRADKSGVFGPVWKKKHNSRTMKVTNKNSIPPESLQPEEHIEVLKLAKKKKLEPFFRAESRCNLVLARIKKHKFPKTQSLSGPKST